MADEKIHKFIFYIVIVFIPIVCAYSIWIGPQVDWNFYLTAWEYFVNGQNPYILPDPPNPFLPCYYPLGFLSFSIFYYIYPLLPKALFCISWLGTGLLINKICRKYKVTNGNTLLYSGLIIVNPYYGVIVMVSGHYDVLVGLCVFLAVYSIERYAQIRAGLYIACAFLLKFVGLIILFPITILKKKLNWKTAVMAVGISGIIYLFGYFVWGTSVFFPFTSQLFREGSGSSIYAFFENILGIDLTPFIIPILIGGCAIVSIFLYFQNTDISTYCLILLIGFSLVFQTFYLQYTLWYWPLVIYWSITHKNALKWTMVLYFSIIGFPLYYYWWSPYLSIITFVASLIFIVLLFLNRERGNAIQKN